MGFQDLEEKVQNFFQKEQIFFSYSSKTKTKNLVMAEFSSKKQKTFLVNYLGSTSINYICYIFGSIIIAGFIPLLQNHSYAGEIEQKSGIVEIIRGNKKIIIDGKTRLKIGDEILVGNKSVAKLNLKKSLESEVLENSKLKIAGKDNLFIISGKTKNNFPKKGKILTERAEIHSTEDSIFSVDVSGSGETTVTPEQNSVIIEDWKSKKMELDAGEKLKIRTDTELFINNENTTINLSNKQTLAIRSRLFVVRTKILNYLENPINYDLSSAEDSFKSIVQILKKSRQMETISPEENLNLLKIEDVYLRTAQKTKNSSLLEEIKGIADLLKVAKNSKNINFQDPRTSINSFNRYVILSTIMNNQKEININKRILDSYTDSFVAHISQNFDPKNPINSLNKTSRKLPKNKLSHEFLQEVKHKLSPELQPLLEIR